MRLFFKLASVLTILCVFALSAMAQPVTTGGTSIQYQILGASPTGLIGNATYTGPNCDSVFAVLESSNAISGQPVYSANEYATYQGFPNIVNSFQRSSQVLGTYKSAYYFQQSLLQGGGIGALFHYTVNVNLVDTGLIVVGTPSYGTFVVTGVIVRGNNDTTGYTSNATIKVGTATAPGTPYANIVATATPSLGALGTVTATLVSPRNDVPANTAIYAHVTTAAVATTETCYVDVYGYYR
jgi:hypothetical protein